MVFSELQIFKKNVLDLVYPPVCVFCRRPCEIIPEYPGACRLCLSRLPLRLNSEIDPACLKITISGKERLRICCSAYYREPLRQALIRFKFADARQLAGIFAGLLFKSVVKLKSDPTIVIAVPLHRKRLNERGYNQAELLAQNLATRLNLPCSADFLIRTRETARQSEQMGREERIANLYGAFKIDMANRNRIIPDRAQIILVDDVLTTGATIVSAAKPLLAEGYNVIVVTVASNKPEAR